MNEETYYLDLDYLSDFCAIKTEIKSEDSDNEIEQIKTGSIDVFKYEIIKMCLDRVLFDREINPGDSELLSMKKDSEDEPSFKLAYNTLLVHKIIKKYEGQY